MPSPDTGFRCLPGERRSRSARDPRSRSPETVRQTGSEGKCLQAATCVISTEPTGERRDPDRPLRAKPWRFLDSASHPGEYSVALAPSAPLEMTIPKFWVDLTCCRVKAHVLHAGVLCSGENVDSVQNSVITVTPAGPPSSMVVRASMDASRSTVRPMRRAGSSVPASTIASIAS